MSRLVYVNTPAHHVRPGSLLSALCSTTSHTTRNTAGLAMGIDCAVSYANTSSGIKNLRVSVVCIRLWTGLSCVMLLLRVSCSARPCAVVKYVVQACFSFQYVVCEVVLSH